MSRVDSQKPLRPSLLDRLIDNEPDVSTEPQWRRVQNVREFEEGVLRDLAALLNTRQSHSTLSEAFREMNQSVLTFGLPDFTTSGAASLDDIEQLRRCVEDAIERFEPRIRQVNVRLLDHGGTERESRKVRLAIEGMLWVAPEPLPILLDTEIEPLSGQCQVKVR